MFRATLFKVLLCICICYTVLCSVFWSCPTLSTLWTIAHHTLLSMGFFRQEYWSWLPFPPPGDFPNSGIEPTSPVSLAWQVDRWSL